VKIYELNLTGTWKVIAENEEKAKEILDRLLPPPDYIVGSYVSRQSVQITIQGEKELNCPKAEHLVTKKARDKFIQAVKDVNEGKIPQDLPLLGRIGQVRGQSRKF